MKIAFNNLASYQAQAGLLKNPPRYFAQPWLFDIPGAREFARR